MAAKGSNFVAIETNRIWQAILTKMGIPVSGKTMFPRRANLSATETTARRVPTLLAKAGIPATNTAGDEPTGLGDLCWDSTNDDVWRCSAYISTTVFTWTKIVD